MRICRFQNRFREISVGIVTEESEIIDLSSAGITQLQTLLESEDVVARLNLLLQRKLPLLSLADVQLCAPVEQQEVWAAGVTYLRSKAARMEESEFSANAYDKVYAAKRPELFFKSLAEKVVPPGGAVGIRKDARWSVPEPELALMLNSRAELVGYLIGNDMSSRDIEGENLLYLPQAKVYRQSCALGPWIELGVSEATARSWSIHISIVRGGKSVFSGETSVSKIKRGFDELAEFLFRSQLFPYGAVLLTGTGIVPQDDFTLRPDDVIEITVSGIGVLKNTVVAV